MRRECNERAAEMKAAADVYFRLRNEFNDSFTIGQSMQNKIVQSGKMKWS